MESLDTKDPTRCVCVIPKQDTLPSFALEVATFPAGSPLFGYDSSTGSLAPCAMSIILVLNKESLAIDPMNWESLTDKLCALLQNWTCAPMTGSLVYQLRRSGRNAVCFDSFEVKAS